MPNDVAYMYGKMPTSKSIYIYIYILNGALKNFRKFSNSKCYLMSFGKMWNVLSIFNIDIALCSMLLLDDAL